MDFGGYVHFYDTLGVEKIYIKTSFVWTYGCQNDVVERMLGGRQYFT